ncbi:kinase-like domain-containing protein [Rhizophagus diaphanus]|nr:kinase-like domain-containing protein [Rhizophagus diaphanus] [Rhizophagus sp. MUCL 43196]
MKELDMNLRNYLQSHKLTWKEIIKITQDIICALLRIHEENIIHKNLHSRNILFLKYKDQWQIGDLGFCGPADKSLDNIYGTLPYLAPEVITEREHNFSSDIYSLGMLMWEISFRYPPFANYERDDYYFINDIINGMRPEIIPGTPLEYKELMEQCWDADPMKRPNIFILKDKINEMMNKVQQTPDDYTNTNLMNDCSVNSINRSFNSKVYDVIDLCEQRNIIKDIVTENRIGQFDSPILIDDDDDDDDEINKPKRMYWEILDGKENDDVIIIKHKKIKLNN